MLLQNFFSKLFNTNNNNIGTEYVDEFPKHNLENFVVFVSRNSKFKVGDLVKHDLSYSISLRNNHCYLNYGVVIESDYIIDSNYITVIGLETNEIATIPAKMFNKTMFAPHLRAWNVSQYIELHRKNLFKISRDAIHLYVDHGNFDC